MRLSEYQNRLIFIEIDKIVLNDLTLEDHIQ